MSAQKFYGLIRTVVSAAGGSLIVRYTDWAGANGIASPGAEDIAGLASGVILVVVAAVWSWMSKGRTHGSAPTDH